MFGYNDMNTNAPNPFATDTNVVLSGAGRKKSMPMESSLGYSNWIEDERRTTQRSKPKFESYGSGMEEMDGAGWMDDIKKGYNKTKSAVKSKTGQKIKKALMEDDNFMQEFNKAKKQLKDYTDGKRKTKPGKAAMAVLEQAGIISKIEDEFKGGEMVGGVNRLKKAYRWKNFAKETAYDGIDLADYGYRKMKAAANPVQEEAKNAAKGIAKMFGGKRPPSQWISYVKHFSEKNGIPYKEALKAASPSYRKLKSQM